jgi:hypothetical protein
MNKMNRTDRRSFLYHSAALAADPLVLPQSPSLAFAATNAPDRPSRPTEDELPLRPLEDPLPWRSIADSFDAFIGDPLNKVMIQRPDGRPGFVSALQGKTF